MMSEDRWRSIESIFHDARTLPVGERARYVADLSGSDTELRAEVDALLAADGDADALDWPLAAAQLFAERPEPEVGQRIGVYRLLRKIGSGGMGSVYLAERADEIFHKQVALKLMSGGGASLVRRFLREREILANLEHPNITRLIDGGMTAEGLPYLVMEFVDGTAMSEHLPTLGMDAKVKLFAAVCDAVHYAHQHLVIHRDLKPANVMVARDGTPKLLDFGIAKLLAQTESMETVTQAMMMTPRYASPEQLSGESVSTLSDIYSLGVMLEEALGPDAPRDLRKIAAKARRQKPTDRYTAAAEMAGDLRRYLAGEPVMAHEDGIRYRAGKFVRRHRLGAAVAAIAAVAVLAAAGVSIWQAGVAQAERAKAQAVSGFVVDLLAKANPGVADKDLKVSDVLDRAAARFNEGWHGDPSTEIALRSVLAESYRGLGLGEKAIAQALVATQKAERVYGPRSIETGRAQAQLGLAHAGAFHVPDADRALRSAIAILRGSGAPSMESNDLQLTLAGSLTEWGKPEESARLGEEAMAAIRKDQGEESLAMGNAYCAVARPYGLLKEPDRQRDYLERGLRILRRQAVRPFYFATCLHQLAVNYSDAGDLARAVEVETEAIDDFRKRAGSQHAELAPFLIARAANLRGLQRWNEAYRDADEALAIALQVWPRQSEGVSYMLYHYGRIECEAGKHTAGLEKLRESLAFRSRPNGSPPAQVAATQFSLARCLALDGKYAEAAPLANEALRVRAAVYLPDSRYVKESKALVEEIAANFR